MKGKEALTAARQRIAALEAESAQKDIQHAQQIARLRGEATRREQATQRALSEVTASLRQDVDAGASDQVRQLEAEVQAVRANLTEKEQQYDDLRDMHASVWDAFSAVLMQQGMTPIEAFERIAELSGLAGIFREDQSTVPITVRRKATRATDALGARRLEVARGQRNAEWVDMTSDGIAGKSFTERLDEDRPPPLFWK